MTRHPSTEGNDLEPRRVDAREDVTVPDGEGGRVRMADIRQQFEQLESEAVAYSEGFAPGLLG